MSALEVLQQEASPVPRFLALEEAKPLPFPIKPVYPDEFTHEDAKNLWAMLEKQPYLLDDESRAMGMKGFMEALMAGDVTLFEIGASDGLLWVQNLRSDATAALNIFFWGSRKVFVETFGSAKEAKPLALTYIMDSLKLRKLRAYIEVENKVSWKMAERAGFKREGWLRKEKKRSGGFRDIYLYGLLREELNG